MFDTQNYSWKNVEIRVNGTLLTAVQGVAFRTAKERSFVYGKGDEPQAISDGGNKSYTGTLRMLQHEAELMANDAPDRDLVEMPPFQTAVSYLNDEGQLVTFTLQGCRINEDPRETSQGAPDHVIEFPIMFLRRISKYSR